MQYVVVYVYIVTPELQVALHVGEEAADLCRQMDHMSWSVLLKDSPGLPHVAVVVSLIIQVCNN